MKTFRVGHLPRLFCTTTNKNILYRHICYAIFQRQVFRMNHTTSFYIMGISVDFFQKSLHNAFLYYIGLMPRNDKHQCYSILIKAFIDSHRIWQQKINHGYYERIILYTTQQYTGSHFPLKGTPRWF